MDLLALSEDVQLLIVRMLAHEAGGEAGSLSLVGMGSLAACCSALCGIVSTSGAWRLAADTLGLGPRDYHALPTLCHAAAWADRLIIRRPPTKSEDAACMHVALRPRGGGWMRQLMEQLGPLGLCSVVAGKDAAVSVTPFVIVACDAREPQTFLNGADSLGVLGLTAPCELGARCASPAALGCLHCRSHGGQGAQKIVEGWDARVQSGSVHRVLFAAQSPEVRDAYRRAVCAATRRGMRRGLEASGANVTRLCPKSFS